MITPEHRLVRWPWYVVGGLGINLAVVGAFEGIYGLAHGAGPIALVAMGISVGGLLLHRWAEHSFMIRHASEGGTPPGD